MIGRGRPYVTSCLDSRMAVQEVVSTQFVCERWCICASWLWVLIWIWNALCAKIIRFREANRGYCSRKSFWPKRAAGAMYRGPRPHRGSYPAAASRGFAPRGPPPVNSFPRAPYRSEHARDSNGYPHGYRRHPEHSRRRYSSPGRGSAEDFRGDGPPPRDYGHVGWLDYYTLIAR